MRVLHLHSGNVEASFPMRVLHLHSGNVYGGVETLLVTLARHRDLCPAMDSQFALCFRGRLSRELAEANADVLVLGKVRIRWPWTVWLARRQLRRLLQHSPVDAAVCHGCWGHAVFGPVMREYGVPLVFWAHDLPRGDHWLERWARRTPPDLVLANSRYTLAAIPRLFPDSQAELLYCAVSLPPQGATEAVCREVRAELNTPDDAIVIIQACRLEPWKGHRVLLEALGRLQARGRWECWLVGGSQRRHEAAYLSELRRAADALGAADRVRFLGQRADVPRLLAAADIHCQPNTGPEPFGIAFVEALYAGLPVVTTALGGACEIVDESCGVLVPPGDADALAAALAALIDDDDRRQRLGRGGPAAARRLCDPAQQLQQVHQLLASLFTPRVPQPV
jgi:glycosyltransferase involved in cell wall biosynthesis